MQKGLCAPHRKHRHHGHSTTLSQALQGGCQLGEHIFRRVGAVAVGAFNQHGVGGRCRVWRVHDRVVRAPQIPREQNAPPSHFEQDTGSPQDVPSGAKRCAPPWDGLKRGAPGNCLDLGQAVQSVLARVQRQGWRVLGEAVAVGERGVLFLNVPAVRQQNFAQILGAMGGEHLTSKPLFDQQRQVAAVVQVGMGQQDCVHLVGRNRQRCPIA